MTRRLSYRAALFVLLAMGAVAPGASNAQVVSQAPYSGFTAGVACTPNGALSYNGNSFVACTSGVWVQQKLVAPSVGIGTASPNASTVLDMSNNTTSMLLPIGTTGQEPTCNSALAGAIRYNSTTGAPEYCNGSTWGPFNSAGSPGTCTSPCTTITISVSTNNVNLFTLAGSPATAGNYQFIVNSGVVVGSTSSTSPAMDTGTFPTNSNIWLVNNGTIQGAGGNGGNFNNTSPVPAAGGTGLNVSYPITITNGSGSIEGGGGGGSG
jgi:hypothetical protein